MTPIHGANAQVSESPFSVVVSGDCYDETRGLTVTLRRHTDDDTQDIRGFLMEARDAAGDDSTALGTFQTLGDDDLGLLNCGDARENAIGHGTSLAVFEKTVTWQPSGTKDININFVATVVHRRETFWTFVTSAEVMYRQGCSDATSTTTTVELETTTSIGPGSTTTANAGSTTTAGPGSTTSVGPGSTTTVGPGSTTTVGWETTTTIRGGPTNITRRFSTTTSDVPPVEPPVAGATSLPVLTMLMSIAIAAAFSCKQ